MAYRCRVIFKEAQIMLFDVTCVELTQMFAFEAYNSQRGKKIFFIFFILKFLLVCSHFSKTRPRYSFMNNTFAK